jgi:hypothetical protein
VRVLIRGMGACVAGVKRVIRDSYGALFLANDSTEMMRENNLNGIELSKEGGRERRTRHAHSPYLQAARQD